MTDVARPVYYNEIDANAAAWLQNLITAEYLPFGHVDTRSILDVTPGDLAGYEQCHFFAGIGGWALALKLADWHGPVWTGSCPCQPFSVAGSGEGFDDERHLWPAWHWLIQQRRPPVVFGEQVASKPARAWFDLVSSDMEGLGYSCGTVDLAAAGVGAPHIRQRLYWVADTYSTGRALIVPSRLHDQGPRRDNADGCSKIVRLGDTDINRSRRHGGTNAGAQAEVAERRHQVRRGSDSFESAGTDGGLDHAISQRLEGLTWNGDDSNESGRLDENTPGSTAATSYTSGLGHATSERHDRRRSSKASTGTGKPERSRDAGRMADADGWFTRDGGIQRRGNDGFSTEDDGASRQPDQGQWRDTDRGNGTYPTDGFWRSADWLLCRDGKFRPVEPGTFPLAHGISDRVVKLRGYGNAINVPLAVEFIKAYQGRTEEEE